MLRCLPTCNSAPATVISWKAWKVVAMENSLKYDFSKLNDLELYN